MKALPYILDERRSIVSEKYKVIVIIQNDIKLDTYKKNSNKTTFYKERF